MVILPNGSITIYSYNNNSYTRINIPKANIDYKRVVTTNDKKASVSYTVKIIIDNEYKIAVGDKIVLSTIETDINSIKDLKDYEVLTITGISKSSIFNSLTLEAS